MAASQDRPHWLAALGRLGHDDLRRISKLVDLLAGADRARGDQARAMLAARPEPRTAEEARDRADTIIHHLEQNGRTLS